MRLLITLSFFLILRCSDKRMNLSDSCLDIIASDSFYFAFPLDEDTYMPTYRLENYLTQGIDSQMQIIDFDCAVVVNPTNEQIDKLREILGQDFDENLKINTRHSQAITCMIESNGIRTLEATRPFRFIGKHGSWDLDIRKDTFPDWKFVLFKYEMQPVILPSVAVTAEKVEEYFGNE